MRRRHRLVVTVSAMGKITDALLALAPAITSNPDACEIDMLFSRGEATLTFRRRDRDAVS
jgi:aspartate kinase